MSVWQLIAAWLGQQLSFLVVSQLCLVIFRTATRRCFCASCCRLVKRLLEAGGCAAAAKRASSCSWRVTGGLELLQGTIAALRSLRACIYGWLISPEQDENASATLRMRPSRRPPPAFAPLPFQLDPDPQRQATPHAFAPSHPAPWLRAAQPAPSKDLRPARPCHQKALDRRQGIAVSVEDRSVVAVGAAARPRRRGGAVQQRRAPLLRRQPGAHPSRQQRRGDQRRPEPACSLAAARWHAAAAAPGLCGFSAACAARSGVERAPRNR